MRLHIAHRYLLPSNVFVSETQVQRFNNLLNIIKYSQTLKAKHQKPAYALR